MSTPGRIGVAVGPDAPFPDGASPDATGHCGRYGGRLAPEALMSALDELTAAYLSAKADPGFQADLAALLRDYAGRPTLLTEVPRFAAEAGGGRVFLKREDLAHTGSHKINNVIGQALLTRRMGKTRGIAETGGGQHRVGAARPRLHGLHGRGGHPPAGPERGADAHARRRGDPGHDRQPDAEGCDQRGVPGLGDHRADHPLLHRLSDGPASVSRYGP